MKVVLTRPLHPDAQDVLARFATVALAPQPSATVLVELSADAGAVIARDPVPTEILTAATNLRVIIRHGAGVDGIPVSAATAAGIPVVAVPGVNARSVAEHAVLLILSHARRLLTVDRELRAAGWESARSTAESGAELTGRTVGIIGMGSVGTHLQQILRDGFAATVLAHVRHPDGLPAGLEYRSVDDLLRTADIVVLACPLTAETRGMIDQRRLDLMRPDALLVNVARGPLVDEEALVRTLTRRSIAGAALDVFDTQPLPAGHPLLSLDNVILTPHMASLTTDSMRRVGLAAVQAVADVIAGRRPRGVVNPEVYASP